MLIMYIKKRFSIHEVLDLYRKYIFYTYYIASLRMLMPMQVFRVKPDRGRRFTVAAWACEWRFEPSVFSYTTIQHANPSGLVFFSCRFGLRLVHEGANRALGRTHQHIQKSDWC